MTHQEMMLLPASKDRAIAANSAYYYTGKSCGRGHLTYRYTSSGNCSGCIAEKRGKTQLMCKGKPRASEENQKRAAAAIALTNKTYTPETPCKSGHNERCVTTHNCIPCRNNYQKYKETRKWNRLKRLYGLTPDDFDLLFSRQNGMCAICEAKIGGRNMHVDHCHKNGHVRGLLCSKCNQAIGLFDENEEKMAKAIQYLRDRS